MFIEVFSTRRHGTTSPFFSWLSPVLTGLVFISATGCDGDNTRTPGTPTDTVSDSARPETTACETNRDCAGGEVCRDEVCRTACLGEEECGAHERCEASICVFFCEGDDGCATDERCEVETGTCEARECETSTDCGGGFRCADHLCVPIDPIICTPDEVRCNAAATAAISCNADGTRLTEEPCAPQETCVEMEEDPTCRPLVCEPFALGCADAFTAFTCDASGTERDETPCDEGLRCVAGSCQTLVCDPSSRVCAGSEVRACADDGLSVRVESCASADGCENAEHGCGCRAGECAPRLCQPGSTRCAGTGQQTCATDGMSWSGTTPCQPDESCALSLQACVSTTCTPHATECVGERLATCDADGVARTSINCLESGRICEASSAGAACVDPVCEAGTLRCAADGVTVIECDHRGGVWDETACPDGSGCLDGACVTRLCEPGSATTQCAGPTARRVCADDGLRLTASPCADGTFCSEGVCGAPVCASPCQNGGTCTAPDVCNCTADWAGPTCETPRADVCVAISIDSEEGDEVEPATTLQLSAVVAPDDEDAITGWQWSVEQPDGSVSLLNPSVDGRTATFQANVVGTYHFTLVALGEDGPISCEPATYDVDAVPTSALHIELLWDTPADADQSDEGFDIFGNSVGSDMDLHLRHPSADGEWFHDRFDCHWINPTPSWGGPTTADDPRLVRDDTDGAGPEIIKLEQPESDVTYTVGVHYWDDWGFGASWATINIFVYGQLRFRWDRVEQIKADMWEAATITWPSQAIEGLTTGNGDPVIIPDFRSSVFPF